MHIAVVAVILIVVLAVILLGERAQLGSARTVSIVGWLGQSIRTHRIASGLFLIGWIAVWCITVATWVFDEFGVPWGIHPLSAILTLAVSPVAALLIGWWRSTPVPQSGALAASIRRGAIVGALVSATSLVGETLLWFLVYPVLLRRPLAEPVGEGGVLGSIVELGGFIVLYAAIGLILGASGGLISSLGASAISAVRRRSD